MEVSWGRSLIPGMKLRTDYVKMGGIEGSAYRIREHRRDNTVTRSPLPLPKDD